mmetsp:Transcript_3364/g.7180  ORF Transcript_3364/g.7180 Transcript_3364/m.7180 type:complete len:178 (+) Transcript_3364:144-677(+)
MWRPRTANTQVIIGIDPGRSLAYVGLEVGDDMARVIGFGKTDICRSRGSPSCHDHDVRDAVVDTGAVFDAVAQTPVLTAMLSRATAVVWEKQRGYIEEHTERAFLHLASVAGWPAVSMPPSEKYHSLGVSASKELAVRVAAAHFGPELDTGLHRFLSERPEQRLREPEGSEECLPGR